MVNEAPQKSAEPESPQLAPNMRSDLRPFFAIAFFLALAAVGWFIVSSLSDSNKLEDCTMAGHRNCAPIDTTTLTK